MTVTLEFGMVLAGAAGLSALSMLLLLGTWRTAGRPAYLAAWAGFCGLGSIALLLHAQRGRVPEALLILLATPAYLLALGLFWAGARRLRGAVAPAWAVALPLLPWYAACALPPVYASAEARVGLATLIIAMLGSAAGIELLRLRGSAGLRQAARTVGVVALLVNTLPLWRIWQLLSGIPVTFSGFGLLLGALLFVATGFAGLAMASALASERDARLVAAAAQREAAALQAGRADILRLHAGLPAIIFHRDCDADGTSRLLHLGGDLAAVTGWPESDPHPAEHLADLAAPGTPAFADHLRAVLRDGSASLDWRLRQPDGSWRWMRNVGRRLSLRPDGGGEVVGYLLDVQAEHDAVAAAAGLERTLDLAPIVVSGGRVAPDGGFTPSYLGRGIERVTGWSRDALTASGGLHALMDPDSQAREGAVMRQVLRDGRASDDVRLRHADGHWTWMRSSLVVVARLPGGGAEIINFMVDVTAERAAEAAVAELDRTLAAAPVVVYRARTDVADRYTRTYLSRGIEALTGWPWQHFQDRPGALRAIMEYDGPEQRQAMRAGIRSGMVVAEMWLRCADGRRLWVRHTVVSIPGADGGTELVGFVVDISAERAARDRAAAALAEGRAQVERLLTNLPALIFLHDVAPDGASRTLYRAGNDVAVTDWPVGRLAEKEFWARNADLSRADRTAWCRAVLRDGTASIDWRLRRPDGGWTWLRTHGRRLALRPDGGGEIVGYQVNIDREREAEASAAAARAELDRTLAVAPLAVFRGRIAHDDSIARSYLSRGIETLTGFPWEHVAAHATLLEAFEVEGFGERAEVIRRLLAEGTVRLDHRVRHADGHWLEVRTTLTIQGMEPDAVEVVGFIVDVTAERQALARAAGAARLASLGEMGTGLAHELKQPLAIMSMAAENALGALGRGRVDAAMARLRRIVDQAQRAAAIIENLRRFARGGDPGAPPEPVPLERAVANALALVGGPLREAGIEVTVALGEPPPVALGQPVSVEQVLVNLLLNAADALRGLPPGAARRIRIAALASPDGPAGPMVGLTIADTGGGIPAAILPRLFEPFVSTKDAEHGTGLGLSICHGLVTSMGGAITARNAADGALFSILLPVALAEAPAAA